MRTLALLADPSGVLRRLKRWRGGLGSAALALALLAGQSGALLHEFSHYASALAAASESKAPKSDHDGKLLRNDIGIENPTPAFDAIHDRTNQDKGFGYLSYLLGGDSRVSLLFGTTNNRFQIPDVPGQTPKFTLDSAPTFDSATLGVTQRERNRFTVLT